MCRQRLNKRTDRLYNSVNAVDMCDGPTQEVVNFILDNRLDIVKLIDLFQSLIQIYIKRYKRLNKLKYKENCVMVYEKLRGDKIEFSIYNGRSSFETVMIPIDEIIAEIITFYEGDCYYDLMEKHEEYFDNLKDVIKFFNIIKVESEFNLLRL